MRPAQSSVELQSNKAYSAEQASLRHKNGIDVWSDCAGLLQSCCCSRVVDIGQLGLRMRMAGQTVNSVDGNETPTHWDLTILGNRLYGTAGTEAGSQHDNYAGAVATVEGLVCPHGLVACTDVYDNNTSEMLLGTLTHPSYNFSGGYCWEGYGRGRVRPKILGTFHADVHGTCELLDANGEILSVVQRDLVSWQLFERKVARAQENEALVVEAVLPGLLNEWMAVQVAAHLGPMHVFLLARVSRGWRNASDSHSCLSSLIHLTRSLPWLFGKNN